MMTRSTPRWHGGLCVDKPGGITSHDVVHEVRRLAGQRRVGHAGTLDPLATGLLVVVLGSATRLMRFLSGAPKIYRTAAQLGFETDTDDITGVPLASPLPVNVSDRDIERVLGELRASTTQIPPVYSAKKIGGRVLHRAARAGTILTPAPITIAIDSIVVTARYPDRLEFEVRCSPGTYIRSLVRDLGRKLGVGATMASLCRLRSGVFDVTHSTTLEALGMTGALERAFIPLAELPLAVPRLAVSMSSATAFIHGREIETESGDEGEVAIHCDAGLVGIGNRRRQDQHFVIGPRVVLMSPSGQAVV